MNRPPGLTRQVPSQGWRQILTARKELLDDYDRAREQSRAHKVEFFHGVAGEAAVRAWLANFLPKRFGVTAGYVISTGVPSSVKAPHFDVVIYDQSESPILWIEDTADRSEPGRVRAIPVEHVKCVLEVKASLTGANVTSGIEHLRELAPLLSGMDAPDERYPLHLPPEFCCGLLFFELRSEEAGSEAPLKAVLPGAEFRGFFGGVVLRGEGHSQPLTGRIHIARSETALESEVGSGKQSLLASMVVTSSMKIDADNHRATILTWTEFGFAEFAFDLLAMMKGAYEVGRISSFYGIGSSDIEKRKGTV